MRASNRVFTVSQPVETTATHEDILYYIVRPDSVAVHLIYMDESGETIYNETFEIKGSMHEQLMSENPEFAPGKPANEFRREDLWYFIDLIRA